MAYARSHRGKDGRLRWYLTWREGGKQRTKRAGKDGLVDASVARAEALALSAKRGTARRPEAIAPLAALGKFLHHVEHVLRRSPDTVQFYSDALTDTVRAMSESGPMRSWSLRAFEAYVARHPEWKPRTVQARAVAARTFAKWCRVHGYRIGPFASDFRGPTVTQPSKEAYTPAETRRLLEASVGTALEVPAHAAFWLGLSYGDLRSWTWGAVKEGWYEARRSKTRREHPLPIPPDLAAALKRRRPKGAKGTDLVCPGFGNRSSYCWPWRLLCRAADVPERGGLKRLRHTRGTLLDRALLDRSTRRDLMAHAPTSNVTGTYEHSDRERLKAGVVALARLLGKVDKSA